MISEKIKSILLELKELGAIGIKTSFEDEGADYDDIVILRNLTNDINLKLIIKIGGAEANTDIRMAINLKCDGVVAPMIESNYALKKYLNSINDISEKNKINIEKGVNLETINAHENIDKILTDNINDIDCITIGRVDLSGSLNMGRSYINSDEMFNIIQSSFSYIKENRNEINTYIGGSIDKDSFTFISKISNLNLINYVETRYIVFDKNRLLENYNKCVELANLFEYYWLNYINTSYKIEKNKQRIEKISERINLPLDNLNINLNNTAIFYSYYETNDSKNNLLYFLNNGIIEKYSYFINYSSTSTIDFNKYLKKYNNLHIFNITSSNAWDGWYNIIKKIDINNFNNFILMKDKIRGPYNINNIENDWVNFFIKNLNNNRIILAAYGTSPLGKLYKFPYIPDKFMCMNKTVLKLLIDNNIFENFKYDVSMIFDKHPDIINISKNPENGVEIKLSKLLLDNNINYVSLDTNGIIDLDILKYYKENNSKKLFEINQNLHQINDTTIKNRLFWTGNTMIKVFEDNNQKFIMKLNQIRNTENLGKW